MEEPGIKPHITDGSYLVSVTSSSSPDFDLHPSALRGGEQEPVVCQSPLHNLGRCKKGSALSFTVAFQILRSGLYEVPKYIQGNYSFMAVPTRTDCWFVTQTLIYCIDPVEVFVIHILTAVHATVVANVLQ